MPRKTKELEKEEPVKKSKKVAKTDTDLDVKKTSKKDTSTKKKATVSSKKVSSSADESVEKKEKSTTSSANKTTASTKSSSKKQSAKTTTAKSKSTKATTKTKTTAGTKKASTSTRKTTKKQPVSIIEYYDLPYRYNQTIVKILAQTPQMLFVYWDISDDDRLGFEERYGKDFFSTTRPVLIIHNQTMNYSFEIEINDFANSWYLHINDANCKYDIELGRRPFAHTSHIEEPYIYVSSSNHLDVPNDHILFEKFEPEVIFKNTKTGTTSIKNFGSLAKYKNMQQIYNIYDLYKQIYKDEIFNEILTEHSNPSSSFK